MFWLRHHGVGNEIAIRRGNFKAYRKNFAFWKVFDVGSDLSEADNVVKTHPELLDSLIQAGVDWGETHQLPQWHDTVAGKKTWEKSGMPMYEKTFRRR